MPDWIPPAAVIGVVVLYAFALYTRLVRLRHDVDQAWSDLDLLLKQRYDHIPALM